MGTNNQIEFSLLHANVSMDEINEHCKKAIEKGYYAICVPPTSVSSAKSYIEKSTLKIITVCDFPYGYSNTASKVEDAKKSIDAGADEIDLVPNFSAINSSDWKTVKNDIESVATICQMHGKAIKVVVESSILPVENLKQLIAICEENKIDYIKTGTGLLGNPVVEEEILKLKALTSLKIVASGGIKSKIKANKLYDAGATRISTSKAI